MATRQSFSRYPSCSCCSDLLVDAVGLAWLGDHLVADQLSPVVVGVLLIKPDEDDAVPSPPGAGVPLLLTTAAAEPLKAEAAGAEDAHKGNDDKDKPDPGDNGLAGVEVTVGEGN